MTDNSELVPTAEARVMAGVVDVVVLTLAERPLESAKASADGGYWRVLALLRGQNTRCPGSWEIVHGRIEKGERPEDAAVREVFEETGFKVHRLYSITVNPFYLHQTGTVQLAVVFAAVVEGTNAVALGMEHVASQWHTLAEAAHVLAWPREREALMHVERILGTGTAGALEDVLRIF